MREIRYKFKSIIECNSRGFITAQSKTLGKRLNQPQGLRPKKKNGITTSVVKCKRCSLVYADPLPIPYDISDHYGVPPEKYFEESYFAEDSAYFSEPIAKLKELVEFEDGMRALDIGAGIGKCIRALERSGFSATGVEASKNFRDFAVSKTGISNEQIKLGMIEHVDFPESSFDFITFGAVLEHVYDPADCLRRALNWLKPGGISYVEVPSSNYLVTTLFNWYFRLIRSNFVSNISPMHEPFHLYEFSLESFNQNGRQLGYIVADFVYYACPIYYMPKLFHRPLSY